MFGDTRFLNRSEKKTSLIEDTKNTAKKVIPQKIKLNDKLITQTELTKKVNQHANQMTKNDLLRHQVEKLEHEIKQKMTHLKQNDTQ